MSRKDNQPSSTRSAATRGSLLGRVLGAAAKALVAQLVPTAADRVPTPQPAADWDYDPSAAGNAYIAKGGMETMLDDMFTLDRQRVKEVRRLYGDEAAAALERANKEQYNKLLNGLLETDASLKNMGQSFRG